MYAIAAAGTGGHVFPALSVGHALIRQGVEPSQVWFLGGDRLEAELVPAAGFPLLEVKIKGWERRWSREMLQLPGLIRSAYRQIAALIRQQEIRVLLGMGSYITVPAGWAARRSRLKWAVSEQNAEAGLANRLMGRFADRVFGSFPSTKGLAAEWIGNPIRAELANFNREKLRPEALSYYQLSPEPPVVGVVGGSLGAGLLNKTISQLVRDADPIPFQILHLAGPKHADALVEEAAAFPRWKVIGFEGQMDLFYAATEIVIARAGGAVAELTATGTPSVLVPGRFGSSGHQTANAAVLTEAGAALTLTEPELPTLGSCLRDLLFAPGKRQQMSAACQQIARPQAADHIARILREWHG